MAALREERRAQQDAQRQAKALASLSANATEFVIVRHGETDWNKILRIQGQLKPGPPLNDVGRAQAQQLAEALQGEHLDAIYSSDLVRAEETAHIIAASRPGLSAGDVCVDEGLRERNMGALQGLTMHEAAMHRPEAYAVLRRHDHHARVPEGESVADMEERCAAALEAIAARHPGQRVLVVVHGGVLHALYHHAMGHVYSGRVANCSMHKLKIEGKRWAIISWNETAHLEKVGFLGQEAGTLSAASKGGVAGDRL